MGIFDRIFGKKTKPSVKPSPKPSAPHVTSLSQFARRACRSRSSISIRIGQTGELIDALQEALQREYSGLGSGEIFSHAKSGLSLRCPVCGAEFGEQAVSILYMSGKGAMQGAVFGGPNVAALGRGVCPGCGGTTVEATFDPARIIVRQKAMKASAAEAAEARQLTPVCPGLDFQSSLDVSPDESLVCFVTPQTEGGGSVVAYRAGTNEKAWSLPVSSSEKCRCMFVAPERVLVLSEKDKDQSLIQLLNAKDGKVVAECDSPKAYFSYGAADTKTGLFVTESSYDTLLMVQTSGDKIEYSMRECGQIYGPGPVIGPDGKIYAIIHYNLYRVGEKREGIMQGNHCISFDPDGNVYCGGGFFDRSGESALHIADLKSGAVTEIPWGNEPINQIYHAGPDRLLIANDVDERLAARYPNAVVTLFSVPERKKIWTLVIRDLTPWRNPLLLSVPEEGWALIQTGKLLKQISLQDNNTLRLLTKGTEEVIKARWLPSKRLLYLARNAKRTYGKTAPGKVECYTI